MQSKGEKRRKFTWTSLFKTRNCIPGWRQRTLKMIPWLSERPYLGNIWEYPPPPPPPGVWPRLSVALNPTLNWWLPYLPLPSPITWNCEFAWNKEWNQFTKKSSEKKEQVCCFPLEVHTHAKHSGDDMEKRLITWEGGHVGVEERATQNGAESLWPEMLQLLLCSKLMGSHNVGK